MKISEILDRMLDAIFGWLGAFEPYERETPQSVAIPDELDS